MLTLDARRHELVCMGCGAPLHHIKPLIIKAPDKRQKQEPEPRKKVYKERPKHKKKKKKPKSMARMLGKIWDEIEDVFD
ncbi:MAG: hypothetical protein AAGA78_18490 [Pseudomonadota bacterium]